MKNHLTFWFNRTPWDRVVRLFIGNVIESQVDDKKPFRSAIGKVMFEEREEGVTIPDEDGLRLSDENAQQMMDALWNIGVRPTEGAGSAGSLAATIRHLEDMRALVFKKESKA